MATRAAHQPVRARRRLGRTVLGVLLAAYGLHTTLQVFRAFRSTLYQSLLASPSTVPVVEWWPRFPSSLAAGMMHGGLYLGGLCAAAIAVGSVGIVFGQRLSMRLVLIPLAVLIGLSLLSLPSLIAVACGWLRLDYSSIGLAPEPWKHLRPEFVKLGAFFALLLEFIRTLLLAAAFVWLRREPVEDATGGNLGKGRQPHT